MAAVLSMIVACGNAQEPKATYHDLLLRMNKLMAPVAREKVAAFDEAFYNQLDSLEAGKGMTDAQRRAKAKELADKFCDEVLMDMTASMLEPMVKRYVALDTLEEYVNALTAEPVASIVVKMAAIKAEVEEGIGVTEALNLLAGKDVEVAKVVCPADYRKNFEKVYAYIESSNSQNKLGQEMVGEDVLKRTEEFMSEKILEKCVDKISPSEMEQYAAFTELPCTKAFVDGMAKAGNDAQAALLGYEHGDAAKGKALMMEMAGAITALPQKAQQWLDKNLPGAKFEDLNMKNQ